MKKTFIFLFLFSILFLTGCDKEENNDMQKQTSDFKFQTEQFADLGILRYQVPGFEDLSLKQKELLYYLSQAALAGRDIFWDQNYRHNLKVRKTLEAIINSNKESDGDWDKFMVYTKRVWFSSGIHHHYSASKIIPEFSKEYFAELVGGTDSTLLPLENGETAESLVSFLTPIIFDPNVDGLRVNLAQNNDLIKTSAMNYYSEDLTQKEVEDFYKKIQDNNDPTPIWYGLNSKLVKENGNISEKVYKIGGMYSPAIEQIVFWLEKAVPVAENDHQKNVLSKLIEYYKSGDLKTWDEYNILWVSDTAATVDAVNGFIEVYGDPLGQKGAFESVVSFKDMEATKRIAAIGKEAQWFEDNSPIAPEHKKENVVGITAKVITVVMESGDASPATPIGINLPNSNWIREKHGSKSVSLGNITEAYSQAGSSGTIDEFYYSDEEKEIHKKYGRLSDNLHTDMHEVIGHASGKINEGVGTPKQTLKHYSSIIEEARADLVALYFMPDQKLIDIGVVPDQDLFKAEYNRYIRNGLMLQLNRVELGSQIEQAHMRNRQLVSKWVLEKGEPENIIEKKIKDGKTYFVINDYQKLRELFGQLLKETQRITSEGDFEAAKNLIENYGVKVDLELHKEVKERFAKLNVAPYKGFINPKICS
jgi:dipeptidyl-peptidase III